MERATRLALELKVQSLEKELAATKERLVANDALLESLAHRLQAAETSEAAAYESLAAALEKNAPGTKKRSGYASA